MCDECAGIFFMRVLRNKLITVNMDGFLDCELLVHSQLPLNNWDWVTFRASENWSFCPGLNQRSGVPWDFTADPGLFEVSLGKGL